MASSPRYYDYWGKANKEGDYHLLVCHSLDVAAVAWAYLERDVSVLHPWGKVLYLEPDAIKRLICFFLALHDLGKFADSFQGLVGPIRTTLGKTGSPPAYSVRHDSLGYILWSREFLFRRGLEMKFQGFAVSCNWLGIQGEPDLRRLTELLNLFVQACTGHHEDRLQKPITAPRPSALPHISPRQTSTLQRIFPRMRIHSFSLGSR